MTVSVLAAAVLGLIAPLSPSLPVLIGIRVLQGFALAGVPATAMAYLAEEVDQADLGRAMGLYIAGNAIGGLSGRVIAGVLAEHGGWRVATAGVSALALACAVAFALLLPRSSFFTPSAPRLRVLLATLARNLADTGLLRLYLIGFALMGAFVTVYNYLTFRLSGAPFDLSTSVIGALFTVYLAGTWSSTQAGRLADRAGRYLVLAAGVAVAIGGRGADAALLAGLRRGRARRADRGILRGALGGERVGRRPGTSRAGAGLGPVPVPVLHRQQRGRVGGRRLLLPRRLAADRGVRRRAAGGRAGERGVAQALSPPAVPIAGYYRRSRRGALRIRAGQG